MKGISAVVITKNEEERIKRCLDSLKVFCDEIIIVDDNSTDRTVEIAEREYQAKVIVHPSGGNFDYQRNLGIKEAKFDWILQMDADEIIPEETARKIINAIENPGDFVAFKLRRKNFLFGYPLKYGGAYNFGIKLFKKEKASYIGRSVHETLKVEGKVGRLDADVYHFPFSSMKESLNKMNFYTDIEAKLFVEERGVSLREIKYRLGWKSLKLFWKLYIKKKGYKDGMYGFIWAIINVIGTQIKWLKIWERALKENKLE